jgi:zinc and cadmium transporter
VPIGIATTLAVLLHEIPQEIGDFGVLVHGGFAVKKAILFNFLSAAMAILGGLLVLIIGPHIENLSLYMLPITAGGFIYIAAADLIPELQHECGLSISLRQFGFVTIGIVLMAALVLFE